MKSYTSNSMNLIAFDSVGGYLVRLSLGLNHFLLHFHKSLNLQDSPLLKQMLIRLRSLFGESRRLWMLVYRR
jgi:hypothetical protein